MQDYLRPESLDLALAHLAAGPARVLAGGTDLYPQAGMRLDGRVLDVTAVAEMQGIAPGGVRIGAGVTWAALAEARLPGALRALQQAARAVGGRQIQNAGTLGGNLCNASPAADGVPPLLVCDAQVELAGAGGRRVLPLAAFLTGPRQTALRPGEVLVAVRFTPKALRGGSAFVKLGARAYLVISIAMVAARLVLARGVVVEAAVSVGACSGVALRLPQIERALLGAPSGQLAGRIAPAAVAAALAPISDVRSPAEYRLEVAAELLRRAVTQAAEQAAAEPEAGA